MTTNGHRIASFLHGPSNNGRTKHRAEPEFITRRPRVTFTGLQKSQSDDDSTFWHSVALQQVEV